MLSTLLIYLHQRQNTHLRRLALFSVIIITRALGAPTAKTTLTLCRLCQASHKESYDEGAYDQMPPQHKLGTGKRRRITRTSAGFGINLTG